MDRKLRVAAAQVAPVYMDKDGSIEKVCETIAQVAEQGVDLVVFPETMIPGYPYWRSVQPNQVWAELMVEYQRNAVRVGTTDTTRIADVARRHQVVVAVGCSEISEQAGSGTLYNTLLLFDENGRLAGRHRKLMPTHAERLVWGMGDGSDLLVADTSLGRIGGLICFEHHMTLVKAAMSALGEEIHCAAWPGWYYQERHPSIKRRWEEGDPLVVCDIPHAVREYAFETQTFVVSASQYVPDEDLPDYARGFNIAAGGSMIVNATGLYLQEPALGKETILYAELDPDERMAMKAYFDAMGHYARWDVTQLLVNQERRGVMAQGASSARTDDGHEPKRPELTRSQRERLEHEYGVSADRIDQLVDELSEALR